ncbi:unnamed protein product [Orchesella dallaii]|uniref:Uncharacterized protein n=1 Tax=Orchesella dallaii TaxID=48710 RepID=A0ABP1RDE8_9HEXA
MVSTAVIHSFVELKGPLSLQLDFAYYTGFSPFRIKLEKDGTIRIKQSRVQKTVLKIAFIMANTSHIFLSMGTIIAGHVVATTTKESESVPRWAIPWCLARNTNSVLFFSIEKPSCKLEEALPMHKMPIGDHILAFVTFTARRLDVLIMTSDGPIPSFRLLIFYVSVIAMFIQAADICLQVRI